jgi:hypothetical protein
MRRLQRYYDHLARQPGEYIDERLRELRKSLERRRKRRLKLQVAQRPLGQALRAALGRSLQASPQSTPLAAKRLGLRRSDGTPKFDERKRVWIVVPSGIQYFRFVENNAFAEIEAACRVTYVFPDSESPHRIPREADQLRHEDMLFTPVDEQRYAVWSMLFEVSCCALASRSASFRIRHEMAQLSRRRKARTLLQQVFLRSIPLFASRLLFGRFRRNVVRTLGPERTLAQALAADRPAAIILPSSLHDCLTNDVIVTARAQAIPTIVLQTSWDNLSSKGIVAVPPDVMGVWGEQSVNHAVDLQGMTREGCVVVGSSYYERFFRRSRRSKGDARRALGLPPDGLTVLFGGSFRQFDEAALLRRIEDAIDAGSLPRMLIFYRPHPGRELREEANFFDFHWKHTVMDEEVAVVYRANLEGRMISQNEFGYSLDRLADIYTAVDLTISPMSSIVLESLLFGLPVLGIGYSDGRNRWGPEKTSQMTHFKELIAVPGVRVCQSPENMLEDLRTVLDWAADAATATTTREAARYFVDNGNVSYARAVLDLLHSTVPEAGTRAPDTAGARPKAAEDAGQVSLV